MGRLEIDRPLWHTPLSLAQRDVILGDTTAAPNTADIVIREYLNDFEEFAAAVNVGLVDDEYAYHIESVRVMNAYFGFEEMIKHWLWDEQQKVAQNRAAGVAAGDYYGELKKLAARWKTRKLGEVEEEERRRDERRIPTRL